MSADWIKMRMGLRTHPKVVRIASALNADRFRAIGALHAVWSLADEHTEDGRLPGYSLSALDDSIGWPGFAKAMQDVEWLEVEEKGLSLPRFDEHNGASAKRRATEAERKRRARKTSAPDADKKRTRERERSKPPISPFCLPEWIPPSAWRAYEDMRAKIRKPMTARARELVVAALSRLREAGNAPAAVLEQSVQNSYQGVFPLKPGTVPVGPRRVAV